MAHDEMKLTWKIYRHHHTCLLICHSLLMHLPKLSLEIRLTSNNKNISVTNKKTIDMDVFKCLVLRFHRRIGTKHPNIMECWVFANVTELAASNHQDLIFKCLLISGYLWHMKNWFACFRIQGVKHIPVVATYSDSNHICLSICINFLSRAL